MGLFLSDNAKDGEGDLQKRGKVLDLGKLESLQAKLKNLQGTLIFNVVDNMYVFRLAF